MEDTNYPLMEINFLNKCKNYIFLVELNKRYGTGFFIRYNDSIYLCSSYELIPKDFNGEIKLNNEIIFKIDENSIIIPFENKCKFILITDIEKLEIDENNILNINNYAFIEDYIYKNAFIFAYNETDIVNPVIIIGKILNIKDGYKIEHEFDTKYLLFCSPICIIKKINNVDYFFVIGIQMEDPSIKEFKYMSYGYSITYVLNKIGIQLYNINNNSIEFKNRFINEFENIKKRNLSFYTFDEYKNSIIYLHFLLAKYYNNQSEYNFKTNYLLVNKLENNKYLERFHFFKNINHNLQRIYNDNKIISNLNEVLSTNNLDLIINFSYFISGYMYVLNTYGKIALGCFRNDGDILYTRMDLSREDLEELDKNRNNIIIFKTFLTYLANLEHLNGQIYAIYNDINKYLFFKKFDTKIFIRHHHDDNWSPCCFSLPSNGKIFNLFSYFLVEDVKINYEDNYAEINLEVVGKKAIFEERIGNDIENIQKYKIYEKYNDLGDKLFVEFEKDNNIIRQYKADKETAQYKKKY